MTALEDSGGLWSTAGPELQACYGDWLESLSWHTFSTWTFRHRRTVDRAATLFVGWLDGLRDGGVEPSVVCWGAEPHPGGHGGHIHALVRWHPWLEPATEAVASSVLWRRRYGRCHLAKFSPGAGGAHYLAKYVLKEARDAGTWGVWTKGGPVDSDVALAEGNAVQFDPVSGSATARRWRTQAEAEEEVDAEEEGRLFWEEVVNEVEVEAQDG